MKFTIEGELPALNEIIDKSKAHHCKHNDNSDKECDPIQIKRRVKNNG